MILISTIISINHYSQRKRLGTQAQFEERNALIP
jgi:hypothetical protein